MPLFANNLSFCSRCLYAGAPLTFCSNYVRFWLRSPCHAALPGLHCQTGLVRAVMLGLCLHVLAGAAMCMVQQDLTGPPLHFAAIKVQRALHLQV